MENPSNNQTTVNGETYIVLDDYWMSDKKQQISVIPGRNENTPIGKSSNDHTHENKKTHTATQN